MSQDVIQQTRKRKTQQGQQVVQTAEDVVRIQVPENRTYEILRYLRLFGYKPERSVLQVHIVGYFGRSRQLPRESAQKLTSARRYGGRTFTVVGRTHDPNFLNKLIPPKKTPDQANPGYVGYLFMKKNPGQKPPHELLPLDFVPLNLDYPRDWKEMFANRGYLVTLHVPANFAPKKNELLRAIRRLKGKVRIKDPWTGFLEELENYGYQKNKVDKSTVGE